LQLFTPAKSAINPAVTTVLHIVRERRALSCRVRNNDGVSDERLRSAARSTNPPATPLCARPDPGCVTGRRSRPELPDPGRRQTAALAVRHGFARLAVHA